MSIRRSSTARSQSFTPALTIQGQGPGSTTINVPGNDSRVFNFGENAAVAQLRITGGRAPNGADVASGPGLPGGDGGAIFSTESLSLDHVTLSDNRAGNGGNTSDISGPHIPAGNGGNGGAVAAAHLSLIDSTLTNNRAGNGGVADTNHGDGGSGGGVFVNSGPLTVTGSTLSDNHAGIGASGIGAGGEGGLGGGAAHTGGGALAITDSTFSGNTAGNAGSGYVGGTGGSGGGIYASTVPSATISASTFSGNAAGNSSNAGNGGSGGGVFVSTQSLAVTNSTLVGNAAGTGGNSIFGSAPGNGGSGGGLNATTASSGKVVSTTIAGNARGVMGTPEPSGGPPGADGTGGGVFAAGVPLQMRNTIVAQNVGNPGSENCAGNLDDGGHSLAFPSGTGCPGGFAGGDPLLAALAANGGPTQTMALGSGSAAIDQVPPSDCTDTSGVLLATDQRGAGFPRTVGPACDIGALEAPEVASEEGSDTTPPDTTVTDGPQGKTRKKSATIGFAGTDSRVVASFQCRLDNGSFESCSSPKTYSGLKKGSHTVEVRAVDAAGNVDPTPASRSWKVKKKKKKKK